MDRIGSRTGAALGRKETLGSEETIETTPTESTSQGVPAEPARASQEQIEVLAYQFWEERGRPEGSPEDDWFRAENQLATNR